MVRPGLAVLLVAPSTEPAMTRIHRLVAALALVAAASVSACKDAGPDAAPASGGAAEPVPAGPPVVGDAPPVEAGTPVEGATGDAVVCTPDTRQPMCTREFMPVCGTLEDNTSKTYGNKCTACSDAKVVRYVNGKCPGDPA